MLRESMQTEGKQVDLRSVTLGAGETLDVPQGAALIEYVDAVVARDAARVATAREALGLQLGDAGLVDAAAVVGAFHGFVRIADSIGIPYANAALGKDLPELRAEAGVDAFPRLRGEGHEAR